MADTYTDLILSREPSPDFERILSVLNKQVPDRPTLFEFFLNDRLHELLSGMKMSDNPGRAGRYRVISRAFRQAGYDYCTIMPTDFVFPSGEHEREKSISLNDGAVITDRPSYELYTWLEPGDYDYSLLDDESLLPEGMKWIVHGPGGVLENVISLTGFDKLCFMSIDDPELTKEIFDGVGSRLVDYYKKCLPYDSVGAVISNDDWGFKSQTMLSPDQMREYVFPWHARITKAVHEAGKPVILHSCGQLNEVMEDVIGVMNYDAKHSYEDTIMPVEQVYESYNGRIAVLGGIDVDYVIRHTPDEVFARSKAMIDRASARGGYGLGTGNSVPEYIPDEHYCAVIAAAFA